MSQSFCSIRGPRWLLGGDTWCSWNNAILWKYCAFITVGLWNKIIWMSLVMDQEWPIWRQERMGLVVKRAIRLSAGYFTSTSRTLWNLDRKMEQGTYRQNHKGWSNTVFLWLPLQIKWRQRCSCFLSNPSLKHTCQEISNLPLHLPSGWKKHCCFCCNRDLESCTQEWQSLHPMLRLSTPPSALLLVLQCLQQLLSFTAWCAISL